MTKKTKKQKYWNNSKDRQRINLLYNEATITMETIGSSLRDDVFKFSKGFDHHALLHELEILGVHDCLIRWIKAFLCDRQQRVRIDGILSPSISPRGGIPQGTRLAPLLFAVLVNRLAEDWSTRLKYVDDATVIELIPRNSPSYLPIVASDVNKFSSHRNMRLNAK